MSQAQPIVVEYYIQNENLPQSNLPETGCNIFMLPKKYKQLQDVKLSDVYDAFPNGDQYHLRFE